MLQRDDTGKHPTATVHLACSGALQSAVAGRGVVWIDSPVVEKGRQLGSRQLNLRRPAAQNRRRVFCVCLRNIRLPHSNVGLHQVLSLLPWSPSFVERQNTAPFASHEDHMMILE